MNKIPDYRLAHILHKGDRIYTDGAIYTITGEPLGFGGTSILYPATSSDSKLEIAIKEAFPGGAARFCRSGGVIRPVDPNDAGALEQLKLYRKQLEKEAKLGQTIRNSSIRAIGLWKNLAPTAITVNEETFTEVSGGIYSILERMDRKGKTFNQLLQYISQPSAEDIPLKTGYLPKIHTTALIMEQVLLALQRVHTAGENGFLFGDIQDGNVFFSDCRLDQGDIGIGNLLDFGCARPLIDGNQTEEIADRQVFSTMGFIPPEILDPEKNNGTLRLTRAADIYSVGCLMLRCVLSSASIRCLGSSPVADDEAIDIEAAAQLGCTENIRNLLNHILQKALQPEPKDRYPDTDAMLADIRKLKQDTAPPTYLLPKAPGSSASFVEGSRNEEIRRITQALKVNTPVFLWGCGGIGKSEIAIKVAQEFEKTSPKGAYFIHYTVPADESAEAMEETVLRMLFEGYKYEPEQPDMSLDEQRKADYRKRIGILRKEYAGALLIIDNFDWPGKTWADLTEEKSYQEIVSLGLNLVFTTRNEVPGTPEVKELPNKELLKLMRRWCTDPKITDEQLLSLIDAVNGHTLMVDIMVKTLVESWGDVTPGMMLDAIKGSRLAQTEYPEIAHQFIVKGQDSERTQHRDPRTAQIYEHLKALFDLTGMSEQDKTVLCCATLLPDGGMDATLFRGCLETPEKSALQKLVKRGWLSRTEGLLKIHPIIREVCRVELIPNDNNCTPFLAALLKKAEEAEFDYARYFDTATCLSCASDYLDDKNAFFSGNSSEFFLQIGQYKLAVHYGLAALAKLQAMPQHNYLEVATYSLNVAGAYLGMDKISHALQYSQEALKILEESPSENTRLLVAAYTIIGQAKGALGQHQKQIDWCKKAIARWKKAFGEKDKGLAVLYHNIAIAYENLEKYEESMYYATLMLQIQKDNLTHNHLDFSYSYHSIGHLYFVWGQKTQKLKLVRKAVDLYQQALDIRRAQLPYDHPHMVLLYRHLGIAFLELKDLEKSFEYFRLGSTLEDPYSTNELAILYLSGMGCTMNIDQGIGLMKKAYLLGNSSAAFNLGYSYLYGQYTNQDYKTAEEYLLFAANHSLEPIGTACAHLGILYLGHLPGSKASIAVDHAKGIYYLERAQKLGTDEFSVPRR